MAAKPPPLLGFATNGLECTIPARRQRVRSGTIL